MTDKRTHTLLAIQAAITADEREAFLARFPSMRGAHVADILDRVNEPYMILTVIEPMREQHERDVPEPHLLALVAQLCLGIHGEVAAVTWEVVRAMVERVRPLLGMNRFELAQEWARRDPEATTRTADAERILAVRLEERDALEAKRGKLATLAPLGFTDANDKDAPYNLYHPLIGHYDCREVNLSNVMQLAYSAGTA
jgi:hypothetical protein